MLVTRKVRDYLMVLDTEDVGMSTPLLKGGGWEGEGPDILESIIKPGMTVIDMGACLGFYSCLCAKRGASTYALEADPDNCEIIRKAAARNDFVNLMVYQLAIAAKDGTARFQQSPGRSDRGRLAGKGNIEVETITLDTFVEREGTGPIDVIRCDVEGAEIGMVASGQRTIASMPVGSWIYIDLHPMKMNDPMDLKPTIENLLDHGFEIKHALGLSGDATPEGICRCGGFPKVFFQKCA